MAIDLKGLSHTQLNDLIARAESRKVEITSEKIEEIRGKVSALLKGEGVTFEEVFGGAKKGRKRAPVTPKYRNPADPAQTWSGRGKRPRWFNAALSSGKKEKDLLI